jgi:hypothetical protein
VYSFLGFRRFERNCSMRLALNHLELEALQRFASLVEYRVVAGVPVKMLFVLFNETRSLAS